MFRDKSQGQYSSICKETANVRFIYSEINNLYEQITRLQDLLELVDDFTVVGTCGKLSLME